jgi:hypothetical protein
MYEPSLLHDVQASVARSRALVDRLRRSGQLVIGSTDADQFARWEAAERERDEFFGVFCRRLRQDLMILREREHLA